MQSTSVDDQHECDLCHKTYRRRDLLVRHRRHCKPNKVTSKRKACSACVQARSKCCLRQPTCSRCTARNLVCEYVIRRSSASQNPDFMTLDLQHNNDIDENVMRTNTTVSLDGLVATTSTSNPSWTAQTANWTPNDMDIMQDGSYLAFTPFSTGPIDQRPIQNIVDQGASSEWLQWNVTLPDPTAPIAAPITPAISLGSREAFRAIDESPCVLQIDKVIRMLRNYPALLASIDYHTPLLHHELYNMSNPEITALPKTTTRQRLIEGFPKTSCLEEWDSLHAMWLYEMMEVPDHSDMTNDDWKLGPRTRGLNLPVVLKMTRRFYQSHPEATDPSAALSNDSLTRYGTVSSAWVTWLVGETARRTVFLAHIVNHFASKDLETGEASPYYEPLNDEMEWNMPLPCSSAAWEAKTEQEWLGVVHSQHQVDDQAVSLSSTFALEPTIKSLLTKLTPEQLRLEYAGNLGLDNSDSLRNLVVHCALAQKF
ncbi:uncharacterized protein M437DRAFT_79060 [Aureobasidium melanogenum CBS 110374]|uniref:Zn(2)-C6 fungal-type domain-containing protein n=1 Tax=Aureobasidium melanogenum (strain CBS 110374) TaxID=1043003 RepID=A0A074VH26_AURM1|nr:uncharacterized protein M437DRAFT_79060 [Aureobasidium melanogenum CBS 110374]KEQ58349.1 hypothetical protein M437DRAFT_79060 [Aureobasidium melanogenum CBS 110374]